MDPDPILVNRIKELLSSLPDLPGVYQYFNREGHVIYIGKAKNLRKRVSSYFVKNHDSRKTAILVRQIADIRHFVVDSEEDALLLENSLIKKYQPRYNVLLKDDKSFPWICVKREPFPRVFYTRNLVRDGSHYFGPYTSVGMVRTLLEVIRRIFPLRNCSLNLSPANLSKVRYQVCLEYQIGNCKGPCERFQSEEDYMESIRQIKEILKGHLGAVVSHLKGEMIALAEAYKFEEAEAIRQKLTLLENYRSKSMVVNPAITQVDVFAYEEDEQCAYVNFFKVVDGAVIQTHTMELKKRVVESKEDLLSLAIMDIRERFNLHFNEIILPFPIGFDLKNVKQTIPQIGDKRKLLELAERNVKLFRLEKQKQLSLKNPALKTDRILQQIQSDLRLTELPRRIECFDNSNIQGDSPVASCVVFIDGKPAKREYRHFNVKTVEGPNDFASMEEIIFRRYSRLINEQQELPQLIVVDGGKGQLSSAVKTLERLELKGKIAIVGIAKRLEEIIYPGDPIPLYLDKNSETLRVIQHLRNEAHRFGITFHRQKRSSSFISSELNQIPGIGPQTVELLHQTFKSVKRIREASIEELEKILGKAKARKIADYFGQR